MWQNKRRKLINTTQNEHITGKTESKSNRKVYTVDAFNTRQ